MDGVLWRFAACCSARTPGLRSFERVRSLDALGLFVNHQRSPWPMAPERGSLGAFRSRAVLVGPDAFILDYRKTSTHSVATYKSH